MRAILPRVLSRLFWLVLVLVIAEGLAAGLCWALWWRSSAGRFVWHPQNPTRPDHPVTALVTEIDNDIGGAPIFSAASGAPRDRTGAKLNAEFPDPASNCGAAYGESLVLGYEVPLADGWVEQLSHLIGCRIANYAVNYYGPDQAYRRFQLTGSPSSFVILGIDPSTIMDVVSQYTALIGSPAGPYALKGRYLLEPSGRLRWEPKVALDAGHRQTLDDHPAQVLSNEYFLPDTRDGPVTARFPYLWTLVRLAMSPRLRAVLAGRPEWSGFYALHHPSGALPLLEAICRDFVETANSRGERALIVVLPVTASFRAHTRFGQFEYQPLVADLAARRLPALDLGPAMLAARDGRSICDFFVDRLGCRGHYSILGNTIVAHAVAAELRRRGYWPRPSVP